MAVIKTLYIVISVITTPLFSNHGSNSRLASWLEKIGHTWSTSNSIETDSAYQAKVTKRTLCLYKSALAWHTSQRLGFKQTIYSYYEWVINGCLQAYIA